MIMHMTRQQQQQQQTSASAVAAAAAVTSSGPSAAASAASSSLYGQQQQQQQQQQRHPSAGLSAKLASQKMESMRTTETRGALFANRDSAAGITYTSLMPSGGSSGSGSLSEPVSRSSSYHEGQQRPPHRRSAASKTGNCVIS
jgi:hypothetical protein